MKNNKAKKVGAVLLAAAMMTPMVPDMQGLKVSAAVSIVANSVTKDNTTITVDISFGSDDNVTTNTEFALKKEGSDVASGVKPTVNTDGNTGTLVFTVNEDINVDDLTLFMGESEIGSLKAQAPSSGTEDSPAAEKKPTFAAIADGIANDYVTDRPVTIVTEITVTDDAGVDFASEANKAKFKIGDDATEVVSYNKKAKKVTIKYKNNLSGTLTFDGTTICTVTATNKEDNIADDFISTAKTGAGAEYIIDFNTGIVSSVTKSGETETTTPVAILKDCKGTKDDEESLILPDKITDIKWTAAGAKVTATGVPGQVRISGLKANGLFNRVIKVQAVDVSKKDDARKPVEYGSFTFFVTPKASTAVTVKSVKAPLTGSAGSYKLTLEAGKSFKLPFVADGDNKGVYFDALYEKEAAAPSGGSDVEGSEEAIVSQAEASDDETISGEPNCFTVVNGVVKGVYPGKGWVTVKSQDGNAATETIEVEITAPVKYKGRTSNTSFAVIPGSSETQYFTISGATFDPNAKIKSISIPACYTVTANDKPCTSTSANIEFDNGCVIFGVTPATGSKAEDFKGKNIEVTVQSGNSENKITIKPTVTTVFENVKSIKQTGKVDKVTDMIEVNVPVGTAYNLGMSVLPVKAENGYVWDLKKITDDEPEKLSDNEIILADNSDVVFANEAGVYTAIATTAGVDVTGNFVASKTYKINVYDPASGIDLNAYKSDGSYAIVGGTLVSDPDEACEKAIKGTAAISLTVPPSLGGDEEIVWTSNKPTGLGVASSSSVLTITPYVPGTYTVTGVTKYTKQKVSFKVNIVEDVTGFKASTETEPTKLKVIGGTADSNGAYPVTCEKNSSTNIIVKATDICAPVKFESKDKAISVNSSGVIKVNKTAEAGKTYDVTCTMASKKDSTKSVTATIKVTVSDATPSITKCTIPSYVVAGEKVKASLAGKNIENVKLKYKAVDADDSSAVTVTDIKNFTIGTAGTYKVWPDGVSPADETKYTQEILVVTNVIKSVGLDNTTSSVKVDFKGSAAQATTPSVATSDEGSAENDEQTSGTSQSGSDSLSDNTVTTYRKPSDLAKSAYTDTDYIIPVTVKGAGEAKPDAGKVTWTSSNTYLATVNDASADGVYKVKVSTGACTGKVTITGVFQNSGKKINITLNIKGGEDVFKADNAVIAKKNLGANLTNVSATCTADKDDVTKVTVTADIPTEGVNKVAKTDIKETSFVVYSYDTTKKKYIALTGIKNKQAKLSDDGKKVTYTFDVDSSANGALADGTKFYLGYTGVVNSETDNECTFEKKVAAPSTSTDTTENNDEESKD